MRELHRSRSGLWSLFLLFSALWLYFLHGRVLVPSDEGRYAEMAREMLSSNDWITTRLNGIKYFEKPPLQTWMNALTFQLFGLGEWQARLWTGLCGLGGIIGTGFVGARIFTPRAGLFAAMVLGSSLFWFGMGHINTLDMSVSAMMLIALCGLLIAQQNDVSRQRQRNGMLLCWTGMALAMLGKGLIGIALPGAVLMIYTLAARDWDIWKRLHLGKGLILFFIIVLPWFILVDARNPEFLWFFFIHEHFMRFTSKVHSRTGPVWYFIPILLAGILPWLGILVQSLRSGLQDDRTEPGFRPRMLLLVWAVFIFIFFSISDSKLPSYILPIFPAIALLAGDYLDRAEKGTGIRFSAILVLVLAVATLVLSPNFPDWFDRHRAYSHALIAAHVPWIMAAAVLLIAGSLTALITAGKRRDIAVLGLSFCTFLAAECLLYGSNAQGAYKAGIQLVAPVRAEMQPGTTLFAVGSYEQSLPFYLRHTTTLVAVRDELDFGLQQQPELWIPTLDAFAVRWTQDRASGNKDIAIVNPDRFAELGKIGLPMRVIARDALRIVVTNLGEPDAQKIDPASFKK